MWQYNYTTELYHHGIKGQKWGVRRFQKKDGRLTNAGKKRYDSTDSEHKKKLSTAQKIAIGVVSTAAIAAGTYFAHKYYQMNANTIIKKGKEFQHMGKEGEDLLKPFYASHLKRDNKAYARNDFMGANWTNKKTLTSNKDIKVAGKKEATRVFRDWLKENPEVVNAKFKGIDLNNKSAVNRSYYSFNRNLYSPDIRDKKLFSSFYSKLSKEGYDAIRDMNDQTQSGIRSPIIVFGNLENIMTRKVEDVIGNRK